MIQRQKRSSTEIAKGRVSINKSCPGPELFALKVSLCFIPDKVQQHTSLAQVNLFNQDEDTKTIPDKTSIFSLIILERISFEV